jgi:hypothetical protein
MSMDIHNGRDLMDGVDGACYRIGKSFNSATCVLWDEHCEYWAVSVSRYGDILKDSVADLLSTAFRIVRSLV